MSLSRAWWQTLATAIAALDAAGPLVHADYLAAVRSGQLAMSTADMFAAAAIIEVGGAV